MRTRNTLRQFITEHRAEMDEAIRKYLDQPSFKLNDDDRRQWILNDEGLYNWARSEGVRI